MAPIIGLKHCSNCRFARPDPRKNIQNRECWAMPPTPLALPHPQGIEIRFVRSVVAASDTCGFWASRTKDDSIDRHPMVEERAAGTA